jgi:hypothetical protein
MFLPLARFLDNFIEHGSVLELQRKIGLDASNLASLFSKA